MSGENSDSHTGYSSRLLDTFRGYELKLSCNVWEIIAGYSCQKKIGSGQMGSIKNNPAASVIFNVCVMLV